MRRFRFAIRALLSVTLIASATACTLFEAHDDQRRLRSTCVIGGDVMSEQEAVHPFVVLLLQRDEQAGVGIVDWHIVDHYVAQDAGAWRFSVQAGKYHVAAFEDVNADLVYQPGEPFVGVEAEHAIECAAGMRVPNKALRIPAAPLQRYDRILDVSALQEADAAAQLSVTLGQQTVTGAIVALDDPRFSAETARDAMWRPYESILKGHPGIYFLEAFDARRTPVLFVHGINGSPANFAYLIERLDRTRFQPWLYTYPSGVYLSAAADHLTQTMAKLQLRLGVKRVVVVAHSMGGLVSRGFLLRQARAGNAEIPLYITMSTPWSGHEGAAHAKHAPVVLDVWRDMAPESQYLRSLFAESLPQGTVHHLLFTFARKHASFGASDDHTVTVASQLRPEAQREALRLYGLDDTHVGVLQNPEVAALINRLLAAVLADPL